MESPAMENVMSVKRIEANRSNSLRSTGPQTLRGKRKVRWNAVKYGVLSRALLVRGGEGKEDEGEFRNLLVQLRQDCQPLGYREELLVEKIGVCCWRLRRVLRCEAGQLEQTHGRRDWSGLFGRLLKAQLDRASRADRKSVV